MNWKFIFVLIFIIVLIFFIIFYPLQFDFYEDLNAKRISDFIVIPLYAIIVLYDIYGNIKKGEKNWSKYIIDFFKGTITFSILYFLIIRRFFSCLLIFINCIFGEIDIIKIEGRVVDKTDRKGGGKDIGEYELIIKQNENEFVFDSNHKTVSKYDIGDEFSQEMKKGILYINNYSRQWLLCKALVKFFKNNILVVSK